MGKHSNMRGDDARKGSGVRLLRVGENVRHAIASVLSRGLINDPVLDKAVVTVSEVRVSPDLRNATVFVMPLGGDDDGSVLQALKQKTAAIRGEISPALSMKYIPKLAFKLDESFDEASHIGKLLRSDKVARDL